ncbi:MAG: LptF/LptG family permease [Paludibacteraceae bacterium]|nr:LptF/LptG family permease [Paludibacteraceae bacterium]
MLKRLDWYIIGKFLGTFFFSIVLILSIAIVFDLTEKMDAFFENQAPLREIILDYYLPFVPYYMNMFSSLFIFVSCIFFTSKLAGNSEIIAMLAAGVSFHRIMRPYFISATFLFLLFYLLGGYVIPPATGKMLAFQDKYIEKFTSENARNVQMQVSPGTVLHIETFQKRTNTGYRSSYELFEGKSLQMRLTAERIRYDSLFEWHFENYTLREFDGLEEHVYRGRRFDTIIPVVPDELFVTAEQAQEMTNPELSSYIAQQKERGTGNTKAFETEMHKRWASPLGAFIMTLLAVTLSSRKVRGGMGKNLGIGLALSALYILFSTISSTFAVSGTLSPFMAVWLPNFIFLSIGVFLYTKAPK